MNFAERNFLFNSSFRYHNMTIFQINYPLTLDTLFQNSWMTVIAREEGNCAWTVIGHIEHQ